STKMPSARRRCATIATARRATPRAKLSHALTQAPSAVSNGLGIPSPCRSVRTCRTPRLNRASPNPYDLFVTSQRRVTDVRLDLAALRAAVLLRCRAGRAGARLVTGGERQEVRAARRREELRTQQVERPEVHRERRRGAGESLDGGEVRRGRRLDHHTRP